MPSERTAGTLNRRAPGSRSRARPDTVLDGDEAWLFDPKTTSLVKTQVDDAELVRSRRSQFVRTAIKIFCEKGYHPTTIKEIANEAGVSAGLIYQYVTDKEDILFLALQLITHTLKRGLPEAIHSASTPIEKFIAVFDRYCRVIDANRDACMLTYRETKSLTREHRGAIKGMELDTNELIAGCVRECIANGDFRDINVPLFVYNVVMAAHAWSIKHWRLSQLTDLDGYIATNVEMLVNAVVLPEARQSAEQAISRLRTSPGATKARSRSLAG